MGKPEAQITSPSSGHTYGDHCKDCGRLLPESEDDQRIETLSRKDSGPVVLCLKCYRKRGNDVR
jgi:hypothetical protein